MRRSAFSDRYASTAEELKEIVEEYCEDEDATVSAGPTIDPPNAALLKFGTEVRDDKNGETVCFVEADTEAEVRAILSAANVPFVD